MLLRTVIAGYLGATLVVAGTGVSAYKLLQERHASNGAMAPAQPQPGPLAALYGPLPEAPAGTAGSSLAPLPGLRPPTSQRGEQHASIARARLPHSRAPVKVSLREPSRHAVRVLTAAERQPPPHPHLRPPAIGYPAYYYRVYYPYAYYSYYPPYPRY
jgi:hypothetical protein